MKLPVQRRTLVLIALVVVALALFIYVVVRTGPMAPVPVTVASVARQAIAPAVFGTGTVEARYVYRIGPTASGRVRRVDVDEEAILASAISPRQDLTAFLIVLRAAIEVHGAPETLVSDGGGIVIVSSTAGQRGEAFHADYAASKGALISFTKSVAVELAERDVTVNCVAPGWIDTEMVEKPMAQGRAAIERAIPLGRIATADDVAGPIVFLCSAMARHVTGEILNVNGGSVLCG